jgi:hypothetical protein
MAGGRGGLRNRFDYSYDPAGTYDAWNRLVVVYDDHESQNATENEYDGLGRRIVRVNVAASDEYDYYYNDNWQLLEERNDDDADPLQHYVWHPYYVDALAVRYYDADTDNVLNESNDGSHLYLQDANFNVTAVVNASGRNRRLLRRGTISTLFHSWRPDAFHYAGRCFNNGFIRPRSSLKAARPGLRRSRRAGSECRNASDNRVQKLALSQDRWRIG